MEQGPTGVQASPLDIFKAFLVKSWAIWSKLALQVRCWKRWSLEASSILSCTKTLQLDFHAKKKNHSPYGMCMSPWGSHSLLLLPLSVVFWPCSVSFLLVLYLCSSTTVNVFIYWKYVSPWIKSPVAEYALRKFWL